MLGLRLADKGRLLSSLRAYSHNAGPSPAAGLFTSQNPETAALFRSHGYEPAGCLLHRIPWGDQDSYGHVNNVHFVRYLETGRVNYFDILASGKDPVLADFMLPKSTGPVLRKIDVEYRAQLNRNEIIAIAYRLTKIGSTSLHLEGMIVNEDRQEVAATVKEVLVMYDFTKRTKTAIPDGK